MTATAVPESMSAKAAEPFIPIMPNVEPGRDATPPGRPVTRNGKLYHVTQAGGRTIVTWNQQGHTCAIVAPTQVPRSRVVELAASRNV